MLEQSERLSSSKLYEISTIIPDKERYSELNIINKIHAQRSDGTNSVGFIISIFDSKKIQKEALDILIKNKERLLPKYRKRSNVVWLLIVLPSMQIAADFILPETEFITHCEGFNAIYMLDDYLDQIQCVNQSKCH